MGPKIQALRIVPLDTVRDSRYHGGPSSQDPADTMWAVQSRGPADTVEALGVRVRDVVF